MTTVNYGVEMVGTNLPLKISQGKAMEQFIVTKLLPEIGNIIRKKVVDRIERENFKRSNGRMKSAVKVRVLPGEMAVEVYNDSSLAPYAKWQEIGVRPHSMTYLLNKKNPNRIPYKIVGGEFVFAGRGTGDAYNPKARGIRWATVTPEALAKGKFFNPGYSGRYLYRNGMRDALREIEDKFKWFTYRIAQEQSGETGGVHHATAQ